MPITLDVASFEAVATLISSLVSVMRQLVAADSANKSTIEQLKAEAAALMGQVESLSATNESVNSVMPALRQQIEEAIAEAASAIPAPVE